MSTLEKRPLVQWRHLRRCRQCKNPVFSEKFTRFLAEFQSRRCQRWQWIGRVKLSQPSPPLQPTLDRVGGGDEL